MRSIKEVRYLSTQEVIEVHRRITDLFFWGYERVPPTQRYEILSLPLLESAVHRPQQTFKGRDLYKTIYQKAAALLRSIISNHPFLDGNKRTAITATALFLLLEC